jgi:hypothetical protein
MQAGGLVIELMVDATANPMGLLDAWITSDGRDLNCIVIHDKDGMSDPTLEAMPGQNREWGYIVDTSTMEIVWRQFGSLGQQAEADSSAVQGLGEMCVRLGGC